MSHRTHTFVEVELNPESPLATKFPNISAWLRCEVCRSAFAPKHDAGIWAYTGEPASVICANGLTEVQVSPSTTLPSSGVVDPVDGWSLKDWIDLLCGLRPESTDRALEDRRVLTIEERLQQLLKGPVQSYGTFLHEQSSVGTDSLFFLGLENLRLWKASSVSIQVTNISPHWGDVRSITAEEAAFDLLCNCFVAEGARALTSFLRFFSEKRVTDGFQFYFKENGVTKSKPWVLHFADSRLREGERQEVCGVFTPHHIAICQSPAAPMDGPWRVDTLRLRLGALAFAARYGATAEGQRRQTAYIAYLEKVLLDFYRKHIASGPNASLHSQAVQLATPAQRRSSPQSQRPHPPVKREPGTGAQGVCRSCGKQLPPDHGKKMLFCRLCYEARRPQRS